jgi:hypothetical protein
MYVQVDYEGGQAMILEGLGPNTIVGAVKDAVDGHYIESPEGKKVEKIIIGHNLDTWRPSSQVS